MKELMKNRIEKLLSKEYDCSIEELNGKDTIYSVNTKIKRPYIKILAYRNCVVVCTSKELSEKLPRLLHGKNRDEIFELPFVYGQTIHYVPGGDPEGIFVPPKYSCEVLFEKELLALQGLIGFDNSLSFDDKGMTSTRAVCVARDAGEIIGIAGAAASSVDGVWEIGVDVMEAYRNTGFGTHLVSRLTKELLARDIVPFYSASVTNIGSQMVANRCGYIPSWVDTYGTTLDGSSVYREIVDLPSL